MRLMIDIPEETYNKMRRGETLYPADANVAIFAIETGTPLEDCEDAKKYFDTIYKLSQTCGLSYSFVDKKIKEIISSLKKPCDDMGEVSDGYHTFNQLYHQRAVLFATIVNQNKDKSWKSFKHSDGNYCFDSNGEWFIVGIDTPQGSYTYHYAKEYWDMFACEELECGKEWDGHTEEDVTRLLSLEQEPCDDCINREETLKALMDEWTEFDSEIIDSLVEKIKKLPSVNPQKQRGKMLICSNCGLDVHSDFKRCPRCGVKMKKGDKVGHWIGLEECSNSGYYCSECHKKVVKEGWSDTVKTIKYCPNCGAKIEG